MSQPQHDPHGPSKLGCVLTCLLSGLIIMIAVKTVATYPEHFGTVGRLEWLLFSLLVFFTTLRIIEFFVHHIRGFFQVFFGRDEP